MIPPTEHPSRQALLSLPVTEATAKPIIDLVVEYLHGSTNRVTSHLKGTGYVMAAGGRYARHGYATCRWIRQVLGDDAPIEVWSGYNEKPDHWGIPGVKHCAAGINGGWPLKAHAVNHSEFQRIIFLDSDCLPMLHSEEMAEYFSPNGALFFPDVANHRKSDWVYPVLGLKIGSVPEMEAGQFLIDKVLHEKAIWLVDYFNTHPEFFYRHLHGDKDLWALAFARLKIPFTTSSPCENKKWGLRHFMPDGTHGFDHLIHTKFAGQTYDGAYANYVRSYLREYDLLFPPPPLP